MKIVDTHCDALYKMQEKPDRTFADSIELQTNLKRLRAGEVYVQFFAIFIDSEVDSDQKFQKALNQIDIFHTEILAKNSSMKKITSWKDIDRLKEHEIGAVLTLEGADAFGNDIRKLRTLYQLGVRSIGLTWNNMNLCADGVGEPRGAGLTEWGKEVVHLNNQYLVFTDVSHLSERGFWDVMEIADYPIASHSNSKVLCKHRRNLTDAQAQALFQKGGFASVVFYPHFVKDDGNAKIADVINHIEHFCSLGGVEHICLGSDFDGISTFVQHLEDASQYQNLINELLKHYKEEEVRGFAYQNFLNHRPGC
ncbi:dipeptidase [Brevibacillus daliensis]|uniref:dipeptidase n=1 Tax=Brevibacillus daliensis TaxID=2892995 RepID=UPI001E30D8A2|nr:dipeptidase [Brevibacillus daliensis]